MSFLFGLFGSRVNKPLSPPATALRIQSSVNGQPIPFMHGQQRLSNNLLWYGNFNYQSGSGKGGGKGAVTGGGGGKGGGQSGTTYYASFQSGICEGPVDQILLAWSNKTPAGLAANGFNTFDGYQGQAAWSYLTTNFPNYALGYSSLAYTAVANLNLGNSPELPNMSFEVRGAISQAVTETYTIGSPYTHTPTYWNLSGSATETIIIPGSPYQYQVQNPSCLNTLPVVTGAMPGTGASIMASASCGVIDSTGTVFTKVGSGPTSGQYTVHAVTDANFGLYTFAAADAGKQVTIIDLAVSPGVAFIYQPTANNTSGQNTLTSLSSTANLTNGMLVTGTGIQPGSVVTNISGTTVTLSQVTTAGTSGGTYTFWGTPLVQKLPGSLLTGQYSVSVTPGSYGQYTFSSADNGKLVGIIDVPDADPSQSVTDFLSNPRYGVGFPSANIGDLTTLQDWAYANGLFISPVIASSQAANAYLKDFSTGLNGEFVFSSGLLTWVPYGDTNVTGYGKTYTAPASPDYSLTDDDFLKNQGTAGSSGFSSEDPVLCVRKRPSDAFNSIKVEYLDRGNSYNPAIYEAKNDAEINAYGLRPADTKSLHMFAIENAAQTSAQLQLGRQAVRNQYTFTVPWYYILLDPMDVIAITDSNLGLSAQWVRILEITENSDSSLTITAEEFLGGTGNAPLYSNQVKAGLAQNYNADPGPVLSAVIFEPPIQLAGNSGLETWLCIGGGDNWGGADVWVSRDNQTYKWFVRYQGSSRCGTLLADFPSGSDPDTSHTIDVDLLTGGELLSGNSTSDADLGHTLCYIGTNSSPSSAFELVSYYTASFVSGTEYDLGTYIRRGQYGTTIQDHPSGSMFARLDGTQMAIPYDISQINLPIYIKLLSFNLWGGGQPTLDEVTPITHTIIGPPLPSNVSSLTAVQNGTVVSFTWTPVSDAPVSIKGYDILYGPQGGDAAHATFLTEASKGSEMTNAAVPPGAWTFYCQARNIANEVSATPATYNLTVTNANTVIGSSSAAPAWSGTNNGGFLVHPSGVLVSTSQKTLDYWSVVSAPAAITPAYIAGGSLPATTYYCKITWVTGNNDTLNIETTPSPEFTAVVPANNLLELYINGISIPAQAEYFNCYVSDSAGTETLQNLSPVPIGETWTLPATGLITGAAMPTNNTTGYEPFDIFVPFPYLGTYQTPTVDTGYVGSTRVWENYQYKMGPGEVAPPGTNYAELWADGVDQGIWTVGEVMGRNLYGVLTFSPAQALDPGNVPYFTSYTFTVDNEPFTQSGNNVVIAAAGGTTITFPTQYHSAPNVTATVVGTSALIAAVSSISGTTFHCQVFNTSGTDVGGTINWTAIGE